ncbi:hypothetical protein MRX96_029475 [Rhipicephalus microplus]
MRRERLMEVVTLWVLKVRGKKPSASYRGATQPAKVDAKRRRSLRTFTFAVRVSTYFLPACSTVSLCTIVTLPVLLAFCLQITVPHAELSFPVYFPFPPIVNVFNSAICRSAFSRCSALSSRCTPPPTHTLAFTAMPT